jgi:hypothetical protein
MEKWASSRVRRAGTPAAPQAILGFVRASFGDIKPLPGIVNLYRMRLLLSKFPSSTSAAKERRSRGGQEFR